MQEDVTTQAKEVMKVDAGESAPLNGNDFYTAANGVDPGIYNYTGKNCTH